MTDPIPRFSEAAEARMAAMEAKRARGERVGFADLAGVLEPHPDLPDCQSFDTGSGLQCSLDNHHDGSHCAEVTW